MVTAQRITQLRESLGLSQRQFASKINRTGASLSRIESGISPVTENVVNAIVYKLGVNRHWLETGEGEMMSPLKSQATPEWAQELLKKLDVLMQNQAQMNKLIDLLGKPSGKHVSAMWRAAA